MLDQYQGVKELYEVVLKAKVPMRFGERRLEAGEPVLYFENINMALLTEQSNPIMARGGWGNMPHVIWEDRSEVRFTLSEGVLSSISMGILLSAAVTERQNQKSLYVQMKEGPFIDKNNAILYDDAKDLFTYNADNKTAEIRLKYPPYQDLWHKLFTYEYARDVAQRKVAHEVSEDDSQILYIKNANPEKQYIVDYYFEYLDEALIYTITKERFAGLFTLEGKFYSKDENDGINYTNVLYMPKVRIVSDINLRLGERADPTTSVFNIIGMPETTDGDRNLILRTVRLNTNIF